MAALLRQPFGKVLLARSASKLLRRFWQMTQMHADNEGLNALSGRMIGGAPTILDTLGARFLAKVYESALA